MPDFYLEVQATQPLSQGDIFIDFPIILPVIDPLHVLTPQGSGLYRHDGTAELRAGNNILATVEEVQPAILLTQSCDATDAARLLFAPLRPFIPSDKQPAKLWGQINDLANKLIHPTRIYLPNDQRFGFPRQVIDLEAPIVARRTDVERFAREGKRRATLGPDGLGYLQFRLTLLFSRYARDDFAWPSKEDLIEKKAAIERKIENLDKKMVTANGRINSPKSSSLEIEISRAELEGLKMDKEEAQKELELTEIAISRHG